MVVFGDALMDYSLLEVLIQGSLLTWSQGKGEGMIMELLDRGVSNAEFYDAFPRTLKRHIIKDSSDHLPLLFELFENKNKSKGHLFHFEHMWLTHEGCKRVVESN